MNRTAIAIFVVFVAVSLCITHWSGRRARDLAGFLVAGQSIRPWQNGLAITGDYLSAASFLGTVAIFFSFGNDGLLYAVGAIAGWPVVTCLIAEPLRALGRYTFADALCARLSGSSVRILAAVSTLCICGSYLISQMVGAGLLIEVLFGIPFGIAVPIVGTLMLTYVLYGGMVATTWVQLIKAIVLLSTATVMTVLVLNHYSFDIQGLAKSAATMHAAQAHTSGTLLPDTFSAISLALAFAFGPAGLPHILMRFFTVADVRAARSSLLYTTSFIGLFQVLVIVLGYAAMALLHPGQILPGGPNMAVVMLARLLGGDWLYGLVASVTFATIIAVVAGVTLAGAASVSHDLYQNVIRRGRATEREEMRISRLAALAIGGCAVGLAFIFRHENVAFLATLPLVIAASVNFPILLLALYWSRLTTVGAITGGVAGLLSALVLMVLSPKVWVVALGHHSAPFPFEYPTLISMSATFVGAYVVSVFHGRRHRLEPTDQASVWRA